MRRLLPVCAGLAMAALSGIAEARPLTDDGRLTFSGFGTLGLIHNNLDEADFTRDISQPKGAGEGWSARTDSLLGAQVGYRFTDRLDTVVQGISRYHDSGDFSPEVSWAFLRYRPDPGVQLRVGRLGWDVYQLSDSRYVGYAYPWVRPPVDHFGTLQLTYIDGADVTFKQPVGSDLLLLKLYTGRSDSDVFIGKGIEAHFDVDKVYGGHLDYETGPWRFRVGYTEVESDITFSGDVPEQLDAQFDQIRAFNPFFSLTADDVLGDAFGFDRVRLYSLGAVYDQGPLQLQAMWNRSKTSAEGAVDSGFVSAGYRIDRVTPYLVYSEVETTSDGEGGSEGDFKQRTYSVGARYDVTANMALKAQLDRVHIQRPGFLWRDIDSDWNGGWGSIFSLGLDFIF
ncbi:MULTISPECIES: porin [Salinicola]|nr:MULTISPECIES: porin [Salinicola]